ncbi:MAG TPA: hypothetical protein VFB77_07740 [Acidimicrobiales bacterium]|nr:hypothetical protein [Acidimicrobiales bacterium]
MTTSSAEPARLLAYPGFLTDADEELTSLATEVDGACERFGAGAGAYLPGGFDADWAGNWLRALEDESVHLAAWVRSVGTGFQLAGTDPDGDGIFSAEDRVLAPLVGEPTIAEAQKEAEGRAAAEQIRQTLVAAGLDPDHFSVEALWNLSQDNPQYRPLFDQLVGVGGQMWDEDFAAGFYDRLGPEGTHVLLGVVDTYAARYEGRGLIDGDMDWSAHIQDQLLLPLVGGFARATRNPDLLDDRAALVDTQDEIQQRHLALLMSGEPRDYDPRFLADGAERILVTGKDLNRSQYPGEYPVGQDITDYPGFSSSAWLYDDPGLGLPEVVALRALDGSTEAAWSFASRGQDHVEAIVHPPGLRMPHTARLHDEYVALFDEVDRHAAGAIEEAFVNAQYATVPDPTDPSRRIPLVTRDQSIAAYNDFMESVAQGDVSDTIKRSAARTLLPHLNDIGEAANIQAETPGIEVDVPFERADVVGFFKELGYDEEAAAIVGNQIGLWSGAESHQLFTDNARPTPGQLQDTFDPVAHVIGAAYQGFNETEAAAAAANSHLAYGISHGAALVGDLGPPVVGLIAGGPVGAGVGVLVGAGVDVVNQIGLFGIEDIRTADTSLPFDGDDLQRTTVTGLREQAILSLEAGGHIPPGTPPGSYSGVLADYFGGTDPFDDLYQGSFVEAFNYSADDAW